MKFGTKMSKFKSNNVCNNDTYSKKICKIVDENLDTELCWYALERNRDYGFIIIPINVERVGYSNLFVTNYKGSKENFINFCYERLT
jgi:hypothetical protein